jgi:hypothetical protein
MPVILPILQWKEMESYGEEGLGSKEDALRKHPLGECRQGFP